MYGEVRVDDLEGCNDHIFIFVSYHFKVRDPRAQRKKLKICYKVRYMMIYDSFSLQDINRLNSVILNFKFYRIILLIDNVTVHDFLSISSSNEIS